LDALLQFELCIHKTSWWQLGLLTTDSLKSSQNVHKM
jgi:hypothetical protein